MPYEEYTQSHRSTDDTAPATGLGAPTKVFQTYGTTFGVTPVPDKAYVVEYRYWKYPEDLVASADVCIIPTRFKHIVIDGAMMYMMRFRSNEQSANIHQDKFNRGIKSMRRLIVDSPTQIYTTAFNTTQGALSKKSFF